MKTERNTVASFSVTKQELSLLTRLIGHHTVGSELDVLYEALCRSCCANHIGYTDVEKPLPNAIKDSHPYGDRNLLVLK